MINSRKKHFSAKFNRITCIKEVKANAVPFWGDGGQKLFNSKNYVQLLSLNKDNVYQEGKMLLKLFRK